MPATIEKLGECIGAAVSGVDISSPIDEETLSQLRRAFHSHSVLVFQDQEITDEQHIAFSEGFGPLEMTIPDDPVGDGGPIGVICNVDDSGDIISPDDSRMLYQKGNHMWHSDGAFRRVPLRGSLLSARRCRPKAERRSTPACAQRTPASPRHDNRSSRISWPSTASLTRGPRSHLISWRTIFSRTRRPLPIRWCGRFPRRGKRCCSSAPTPPTSSAGLSKRAGPCCASCSNGRRNRSSSTATNGNCTISSCGTTSAACIAGDPGTVGTIAASCIAPRFLATIWYQTRGLDEGRLIPAPADPDRGQQFEPVFGFPVQAQLSGVIVSPYVVIAPHVAVIVEVDHFQKGR